MLLYLIYVAVAGGLFAGINSNFCGFMIKSQDFPSFWVFIYWLNPLHYALEGITVTQFHKDDTEITTITGVTTTAERFISEYYSSWSYDHRGYDVLGLLLWSVFLRYALVIKYYYFSI